MPGTETSIWLAIKARIEALPVLPMPIAWPASTFSPDGAEYLSVGEVTVDPVRLLIGSGAHDRRGSIIVGLVSPLGQASEVYREKAAQIAAHFPEDLRLTHGGVTVRIPSRPTVQAGYRDEPYWRVPVVIPWRSFS
jgi:hypothetical protein